MSQTLKFIELDVLLRECARKRIQSYRLNCEYENVNVYSNTGIVANFRAVLEFVVHPVMAGRTWLWTKKRELTLEEISHDFDIGPKKEKKKSEAKYNTPYNTLGKPLAYNQDFLMYALPVLGEPSKGTDLQAIGFEWVIIGKKEYFTKEQKESIEREGLVRISGGLGITFAYAVHQTHKHGSLLSG
ncbi:hypothetical protein HYS31_05275 [Candidatus Woesearchaeota archaeon]|nr:hypothetical protein [Candidatus Woesearchaeota archaeon]